MMDLLDPETSTMIICFVGKANLKLFGLYTLISRAWVATDSYPSVGDLPLMSRVSPWFPILQPISAAGEFTVTNITKVHNSNAELS